jgi:hypothetical protein
MPTQLVVWQWPCSTHRQLQVLRYTNINTAKVSNHKHMRQAGRPVLFLLATSCPCKVRKYWSLCLEACMFEWQCGRWDLSQPGRRYFQRVHSHIAERCRLASPCLSVCLFVSNYVIATRIVLDEFWCYLLVKNRTDFRKHTIFCKIQTICLDAQAFAIFEVAKCLNDAETARM